MNGSGSGREVRGVTREPLERPGERGRRGLVAGGEQRDELVAELFARRPGASEQVEDRVAAAGLVDAPRRRARRCAWSRLRKRPYGPMSRCTSDIAIRFGVLCVRSSALRSACLSSGSWEPKMTRWMISSVSSCIFGSALNGVLDGPRVQVLVRELLDGRRPALQRLAVEGRQHEPALPEVLVAVQDQDRVAAHERLEEVRRVPALEHVGRGRVGALDLLGVAREHHRRVRPRRPDGERLAVASLRAAEEVRGAHDPLDRLERVWRSSGPAGARVRTVTASTPAARTA